MTTPNSFNGYIFAILHSSHHTRITKTSILRLKAYLIFHFSILLFLVCMLPTKFSEYIFSKKKENNFLDNNLIE